MYSLIIISIVTIWLVVLGWYDCYYRRLPNALTLGGAAVFLAFRYFAGGTDGVLNGALGGAIGAAFLLLPYILKGAGAGDLKMFMSVGCLSGYPAIFLVMTLASVFGIVLGVGMILAGRLDSARLKYLFNCCVKWNYDRRAARQALPEKSRETVRVPFGIAIAAATWVGLMLIVWF